MIWKKILKRDESLEKFLYMPINSLGNQFISVDQFCRYLKKEIYPPTEDMFNAIKNLSEAGRKTLISLLENFNNDFTSNRPQDLIVALEALNKRLFSDSYSSFKQQNKATFIHNITSDPKGVNKLKEDYPSIFSAVDLLKKHELAKTSLDATKMAAALAFDKPEATPSERKYQVASTLAKNSDWRAALGEKSFCNDLGTNLNLKFSGKEIDYEDMTEAFVFAKKKEDAKVRGNSVEMKKK